MMVAGLSVAGFVRTDPPCAYVLGRVGSTIVATPAVVVFVPPEEAGVQPIRVHLDEEGQSIRGYSSRGPGEDARADAGKVFVSGLAQVAHVVTTLEESGAGRTCESLGMSTPAVPIHVPASAFEFPGALVETPTFMLQFPDRVGSAPGHILSLGDNTVVLPMQRLQDSAPSWPIAEPTLSVDIAGEPRTTRFLPPRVRRAVQPGGFPSIPVEGDPNRAARLDR